MTTETPHLALDTSIIGTQWDILKHKEDMHLPKLDILDCTRFLIFDLRGELSFCLSVLSAILLCGNTEPVINVGSQEETSYIATF